MEKEDVQNPLENPLILSKMFEFLQLKDRMSFRLVNKLWRDVCLEQWRKSTLFVIGRNNPWMKEFLELCAGGKYEAYRITEFPFRRICICQIQIPCADLTEEIKENIHLSESNKDLVFPMEFWDVVAPSLHYLKFSHSSFCASSILSGLGWILLEKCKNLKEFVMCINTIFLPWFPGEDERDSYEKKYFTPVSYKYDGKWFKDFNSLQESDWRGDSASLQTFRYEENGFEIHSTQMVDFWRGVFDMIPNVKNIYVTVREKQTLFKALSHPTRTGKKLIKLKTLGLELNDRYGMPKDSTTMDKCDSIQFLEYMKIVGPIPHVELYLCDCLTDLRRPPFPFHQLLNFQKWTDSLTKLILNVPCKEDDEWFTDLTGRSFPQLKHLELLFKGVPLLRIKVDFGMLCGMPLLRKLFCFVNNISKSEENLSENELKYKGREEWIECSNVEDFSTLELTHLEEFQFRMWKIFGNEALQRLGKIMKNLKHLAVSILGNVEAFQQFFPKLEKLTFLPYH